MENSSKTETREERGPTPETRRRLRRDPIEELYRRGSIGAMQWASALEIRSILEAVEGRFVGETWRRIEHSDEGRGRQANRHPLDGLPPGLLTPYLDRLIPWAEKMRGRGKRGRSYLGITLEVLCAGTSLRQMDRQMRWRRGSTCAILTWSLEEYGDLKRAAGEVVAGPRCWLAKR